KALALAEALGDVPLQVMGSLYLGATCFWTGDDRRAKDLLLNVVQLAGGELNLEQFGLDRGVAVTGRQYLTMIFAHLGRFGEGIVHAGEAMRVAGARGRPASLGMTYWYLANLQFVKGDPGRAVALLERALAVSREWSQTYVPSLLTGSLGYAYALLRRTDEGLPMLEHALSTFVAMRHRTVERLLLAFLGEAYLLAGRLDEAFVYARRALTVAREVGQRSGGAPDLRLLGEIAAHSDPPEHA